MGEILAAIKLFMELLGQIRALKKFYDDNAKEAWFQQSLKTFDQLASAKTTEEKKRAVSALARLWASN